MNEKSLIDRLVVSVGKVPTRTEVLGLRQYSLPDIERRAKRFLGITAEACGLPSDRGDWLVERDRTLVRLPQGARAVVYHASGAMKLITGLNPMEHLFKKVDERQRLIRLVRETARRLRINDWIGAKESLEFENLWQLKAAAADTNGKTVPPVLCRALGAFRHSVNGLPVWGAASVAIRVAGAGQLDCLQIQLRESTGEVVEQAKVLRPDHAAGQILLQMNRLFGNSRIPAAELAVPGWMRFGYLSLPKRKAQRVLAPFYVASIQTKSPQETQSYLFATPATETAHLPLCLNGSEARPGPARNVHATCT